MKNNYEQLGGVGTGVYQQFLGYTQVNGFSATGHQPLTSCTTEGGRFTYIVVDGNSVQSGRLIQTLERDINTGMYISKQMLTQGAVYSANQGLCVLGGYVYSFFDGGVNMGCLRYTIGIDGTLSTETNMTIPTIALAGGQQIWAWTNGTNLFASVSNGTCTFSTNEIGIVIGNVAGDTGTYLDTDYVKIKYTITR